MFPWKISRPGVGTLVPVGASQPLERQGPLACPAGAPFLGKKWGKEPPGEEVPPPEPPSLVGLCGGEAVPLTGYLACGPHIERPVTARPPAGRAGGVGRCPLGEGRENPFDFPLFPPVNKPLLPPARAGGRAMRRWSWRPQARLQSDQPPSPVFPTREWGSKGKEPPSPWCSFPYFSKEIGPRPGGPSSPPVPTAMEKAPHPPARRASPHSPSGEVFLWEQLKKILNIPLLVS